MADRKWREIVLGSNEDVWDKSKPVEGYFVKTEQNMGAKKNSNLYSIKTTDGIVKVWGSTVLDDKLDNVDSGSYVKIEYDGMKKSGSGSDYHLYSVHVDDDAGTDETEDMPADFLKDDEDTK